MKIIECEINVGSEISVIDKTKYINTLLKVGYDTLDLGCIDVSKNILQSGGTSELLEMLNMDKTKTSLMMSVCNSLDIKKVCLLEKISCIKFDIQHLIDYENVSSNLWVKTIEEIFIHTKKYNKKLIIYMPMYIHSERHLNMKFLESVVSVLSSFDVKTIVLYDRVGVLKKEYIKGVLSSLIAGFVDIEFGVKIFSDLESLRGKMIYSYDAGCRRFDTSIKGLIDEKTDKDKLISNIPTEKILSYMSEKKITSRMNPLMFEVAYNKALDYAID